MSSPDSNKVAMYAFFALACLFFMLAVYVRLQDALPFSDKDLTNPESYFKGLMIVSSLCTIISIGFALKKKGTIKSKDALLAAAGFCAVLAGIVISWQNNASLAALSLTTLAGLLSASSLDTQ